MSNRISSAKAKIKLEEMPLDIRQERIQFNQLTPEILKSFPYGIIAFDTKGKIIADNNKHWLINAKVPDWRERDVFKLVTDNSIRNLLNDFINQPTIKETEVEVKIKELLVGKSFEMILPKCRNILNKSVMLHLIGVPLINTAGNIIGGLLVIDDVTQYFRETSRVSTKKLYEVRLKDLANNLAVSVNENKILETNLASQKDIENLNILQELVIEIGKELHNPISIIKKSAGFLDVEINNCAQLPTALDIQPPSELERNSQITNKIRRNLSIIIQEIDVCNKVISDLIKFVQTPNPKKDKVKLREAVEDALHFLTVTMPPNVKVIIDFPKILPCLYIDRHQIKQALARVIAYSLARMLSGGKLIFSAKIEDAAFQFSHFSGNLVIAISDTGIGIPNKKRSTFLNSLFAQKIDEIDFGLVIARYLIKANGGKFEIKTTPGIGTTFLITLPTIGKFMNEPA